MVSRILTRQRQQVTKAYMPDARRDSIVFAVITVAKPDTFFLVARPVSGRVFAAFILRMQTQIANSATGDLPELRITTANRSVARPAILAIPVRQQDTALSVP